tara:strand:+ start:406 stop:624 length:219 start_codon:yes stop_codon:yes gene_type:complete
VIEWTIFNYRIDGHATHEVNRRRRLDMVRPDYVLGSQISQCPPLNQICQDGDRYFTMTGVTEVDSYRHLDAR